MAARGVSTLGSWVSGISGRPTPAILDRCGTARSTFVSGWPDDRVPSLPAAVPALVPRGTAELFARLRHDSSPLYDGPAFLGTAVALENVGA
jgi:hypothetical protein